MSAHDAAVPLKHMRDAALRAIEIARPLTRDHLSAYGVETLALTRLVEIVGEASRRVPDDVRARYPDIPWQQIAGTRNRLVHGYDSVDLDILWRIVRGQLPELALRIEGVLGRLG